MKFECAKCSNVFKHQRYISKNFCISKKPLVCPNCKCSLIEDTSDHVKFKYEIHALLIVIVGFLVYLAAMYLTNLDIYSVVGGAAIYKVLFGIWVISGFYLAVSHNVNLWAYWNNPAKTIDINKDSS